MTDEHQRALEARVVNQRARLRELEAIVANHSEHYRIPIERAGEAARRHIVAWQEQYYRAERAEEALREIVRRERRSEYSSIYAAPGEFAALARECLALAH